MAHQFKLFSSLRYDPALLQVPDRGLDYAGWNYVGPSPLYMLDFHRDRLLRAAVHWGWDAAIGVLDGEAGLKRLAAFIEGKLRENHTISPMRIKVTVSKDGEMGVDTSEVPETALANLFPEQLPAPGAPLSRTQEPHHFPSRETEYVVVVADLGTHASEYTHFKTTKREMYDKARERARISLSDRKEVLLVNETNGTVMEGSTTTPYFWRESRWVTPPVSRQYSPADGSGGQDGTSRRWALER